MERGEEIRRTRTRRKEKRREKEIYISIHSSINPRHGVCMYACMYVIFPGPERKKKKKK